ncbi:hypothetical protein [Hyphococcus luteus]|uniref:Uncharacterized protein n=1 Tax=Hyphococcus luteus TaxID=2058213 RepID=A0A2S7K5N0_9PROT|nr:hypothetical protein [Marinicaulis flavus]PQA87758.1 hypothetical protein CW354_05195 [Marinicaulis flavus]
MMRNLCFLLILVFGSIVAGCATTPAAPVVGVNSLGVVSAFGDEFQMLTIGTTVFNNSEGSGDISEWGVNELAINSMKTALAGKYELVDVEYPREFFNTESKEKITGAWIDNTPKLISDMVRDKITPVSGEAPDAYLIVIPEYSATAFRGYPTFVDLGLYSMSLLGDRKTYVWVGAQMVLVDADTWEVLRRKSFRSSWATAKMEKRLKNAGAAYWRVDNSLWAKDFDSLVEEQKEAIRATIEDYVKDAAARTLEQIGLTPTVAAEEYSSQFVRL